MSILKELIALVEAPEVPVELKDVIAAFPKNHTKALQHLWGGKRLVWHGERFFDDGELGPAYTKAVDAAEEFINNGYETDTRVDVDFMSMEEPEQGHDFSNEFEWMTGFGDRDGGERQEVYLGYDPKRDKLYIGFDAWVSEETFNNDFDAFFEKATGEEFNTDEEGHQEVFDSAWKEYQNQKLGFWGLIFEITNHNGEYTAEEAFPAEPGGFYRGVFKQFKQYHKDVVDLRLD